MSRIIIAAVLVAAVAVACIASELTVHSCSNRISDAMDNAAELAEQGNLTAAQAAATKAESVFKGCEGALAVFINHSLVEQLGEQIARLPTLASAETQAEFLSELSSARVMLAHIVRDNHPTLLNIL